ncbi:hypothetical protein FWF93_00295 [Candidatus Saccharibacteria bacterium]|nr:hypothetical protein [Candidatus Saccharibacteria bacterium]
MNSIQKSRAHTLKPLFVAIILAVATVAVFKATPVFASAAGSGAGGGTITGAGAATTNGFGWKAYSRTGSGPGEFMDGTKWSKVQSTCRDTNTVWLYVVQTSEKTLGTAVVYRHKTLWDSFAYKFSDYNKNRDLVKAEWDKLTKAEKNGTVWGDYNKGVAWLCNSADPAKDWSYGATSNVTSPVSYRTTLNFKHTLKNNGSSSSGLKKTDYWTTGKGANSTKKSSGALGPKATKLVENYNSYTTTASDIGQNTVCQTLNFSPKAHNSTGTGKSEACASVYSPWTVSATTTINSNLAKPGDNISFTHKLSNNDRVVKDDKGNWVTVTGTIKGAETNTVGSLVNTTIPFAGPNTSFMFTTTTGNGESISNSVPNSFIVSADGAEVGKKYCQYVSVDKPARNNTTAASGAAACVSVPYNYTTAPIVTGAQGTSDLFQSVEAGDTMVVGQQIEVLAVIGTNPNADYKTKTPNIDVRVFCTKDDYEDCPGWTVVTTSGNYASNKNGDIGNRQNWQIPVDSPVGTKYCFQAIAVNGQAIANGANNAGPISNFSDTSGKKQCVTVVKSPTLQIHGGDSWSGMNCPEQGQNSGGFDAKQPSFALDPASGAPASSATWSQYGLFSAGVIANTFGSGGHIHNADNLNTLQTSNKLKFSGDSINVGGNYLPTNEQHCLSDAMGYYKQRLGSEGDHGEAVINEILNDNLRPKTEIGKKILWYGEGNKTLDVSGVDFYDRDLVIVVDGDITINGDVAIYNHSYRSIENLPNLMVMASGNIIVEPGVTRLDGVYVAQGTFFDCGDKSILGLDGMSNDFSLGGVCDQQLVVNGAVVANNTRFHRTHRGSDGIDDNIFNPTPAEIIKYPVGVWLQSYDHYRNLSNRITTMFYREVAPRV